MAESNSASPTPNPPAGLKPSSAAESPRTAAITEAVTTGSEAGVLNTEAGAVAKVEQEEATTLTIEEPSEGTTAGAGKVENADFSTESAPAQAPAQAPVATSVPAEALSESILTRLLDGDASEIIATFFQKYDEDDNKSLDKDEIKQIFKDMIKHIIEASPDLEEYERACELEKEELENSAQRAADAAFEKIDTDKSGTVDLKELTDFAKSGDLLREALGHIEPLASADGNNTEKLKSVEKSVKLRVKLKALLAEAGGLTLDPAGDDVKAIFDKFDEDHSNTLDHSEMVSMFVELIKKLFAKLDPDIAEYRDDENEWRETAEIAANKCVLVNKEKEEQANEFNNAEADDGIADETGQITAEEFRAFLVSPDFAPCFDDFLDE